MLQQGESRTLDLVAMLADLDGALAFAWRLPQAPPATQVKIIFGEASSR
jgi:hypothetical protein